MSGRESDSPPPPQMVRNPYPHPPPPPPPVQRLDNDNGGSHLGYTLPPSNPWAEPPPVSAQYPDIYTVLCSFPKANNLVSKQAWPYQRTFSTHSVQSSRAMLSLPYFKHIAYGQPPEDLVGFPGDIYLDFSTPQTPLIYYSTGEGTKWIAYNEREVVDGRARQAIGVLYHPVFREDKTYLRSDNGSGVNWGAWMTKRKRCSVVWANPDRMSADEPSHVCDPLTTFYTLTDVAMLRESKLSSDRKDAEIKRRVEIKDKLSLYMVASRPGLPHPMEAYARKRPRSDDGYSPEFSNSRIVNRGGSPPRFSYEQRRMGLSSTSTSSSSLPNSAPPTYSRSNSTNGNFLTLKPAKFSLPPPSPFAIPENEKRMVYHRVAADHDGMDVDVDGPDEPRYLGRDDDGSYLGKSDGRERMIDGPMSDVDELDDEAMSPNGAPSSHHRRSRHPGHGHHQQQYPSSSTNTNTYYRQHTHQQTPISQTAPHLPHRHSSYPDGSNSNGRRPRIPHAASSASMYGGGGGGRERSPPPPTSANGYPYYMDERDSRDRGDWEREDRDNLYASLARGGEPTSSSSRDRDRERMRESNTRERERDEAFVPPKAPASYPPPTMTNGSNNGVNGIGSGRRGSAPNLGQTPVSAGAGASGVDALEELERALSEVQADRGHELYTLEELARRRRATDRKMDEVLGIARTEIDLLRREKKVLERQVRELRDPYEDELKKMRGEVVNAKQDRDAAREKVDRLSDILRDGNNRTGSSSGDRDRDRDGGYEVSSVRENVNVNGNMKDEDVVVVSPADGERRAGSADREER